MSDSEQPPDAPKVPRGEPEVPSGLDPDAAIRRIGRPGGTPAVDPDPATGATGRTGGPGGTGTGAQPEEDGWDRPRPLVPIIDTGRYQRIIGGLGLALVIAFSVILFVHGGGNGTPGIAAGQRLHRFVAPLATSDLDASANAHPVCNPARPALRGLNVCGRKPIVLAFFTLGAKACINQVDALQAEAAEFPHVEFAAVAIGAGRTATAKVVAQHHWTIPVAYDSADVVGQVYGVEVCPLAEVGNAQDRVAALLIGKYWSTPQHLAAEVTKLGLAH